MRIRRSNILVLTFALAGCVGTIKGYPGPSRSFQNVAIVAGGRAAGGLGFSDVNEFVEIVAINKRDHFEDWRGGNVHLLPGSALRYHFRSSTFRANSAPSSVG